MSGYIESVDAGSLKPGRVDAASTLAASIISGPQLHQSQAQRVKNMGSQLHLLLTGRAQNRQGRVEFSIPTVVDINSGTRLMLPAHLNEGWVVVYDATLAVRFTPHGPKTAFDGLSYYRLLCLLIEEQLLTSLLRLKSISDEVARRSR